MPRASNSYQCSTSFPPTTLSIMMAPTLHCLPVAGTPRKSPRWVPVTVILVATFSPSATWSSTLTEKPGKAARKISSLVSRK